LFQQLPECRIKLAFGMVVVLTEKTEADISVDPLGSMGSYVALEL
jgi:hypothetical protein